MSLKKKLISIFINTGSYDEIVKTVCALPKKTSSSYVCVSNVHMLVEAYEDKGFAEVVNTADVATPDGKPLCIAHKWLYGQSQDRVAGMFLMQDVMKYASAKNQSVYFYGGTEKILNETEVYCARQYPDLKIAGSFSPPFRDLSSEENAAVIEKINKSGASFVFVALGCPKQEKWMASMHGKINACMIGIGGALPVMIGVKKRAPMWIQNNGLEWLFRFIQEPKRLFRRYWHTNRIFLILLFKELFYKNRYSN